MARRTVSILGCGWLGLPLGQALAGAGHHVKGATTMPEKLPALEAAGIEPFCVRLAPGVEGERAEDFFHTGVLVLTVPPPRGQSDKTAFYQKQVRTAAEAASAGGAQHVLYTSSTGVYPPLGREVTEDDAPADCADLKRESARAVLAAEHLLREEAARAGFGVTVVRLAGLYGPGREPGRFLARKTDLPDGGRPVNFVHRDDAVGVIRAVIEQGAWGETFNACASRHPARRQFFRQKAAEAGLAPPTFTDDAKGAFKIVSNEKARRRLGYRFRHPDPLEAQRGA